MFQTKLKQLRERDGLSQVKLAKLLNVSQSTVGMWESGRNKPTFAMLGKIAQVFSVPVGSLVEAEPPTVLASEAAGYGTTPMVLMPDNSMSPELMEGDMLTLRPVTQLTKGDVVAFYQDGRLLVRHITLSGETVAATARNIELAPVMFHRGKEKEAGIQIVGKVVSLQRRFK